MRRSGFTLLEMVLALSIGLVLMISLYSVLSMQVQQAQTGRLILAEGTLARSILTRMAKDILSNLGPVPPVATAPSSGGSSSGSSGTSTTDTSSTFVFNNGVYGTNNVLVLTVSKVPPPGSDPTQQATVADLRRVSYWLASGDPSGLAWQELQQATGNDLSSIPPDVDPSTYKIMAAEVKDVAFQYFDGTTWQGDIPIGPPSAISITLTFSRKNVDGSDLPDSQLPKYTHVVAIPAGNNFPQTNQGS
jgi:prepilin-type N-terminal cleavage/methylation domain-containing protein